MLSSTKSGWSITVDTGGTFTDVVIADDKGRFIIGKAPTTPDRIFVGLKQALETAAEEIKMSLDEITDNLSKINNSTLFKYISHSLVSDDNTILCSVVEQDVIALSEIKVHIMLSCKSPARILI